MLPESEEVPVVRGTKENPEITWFFVHKPTLKDFLEGLNTHFPEFNIVIPEEAKYILVDPGIVNVTLKRKP